MSTALAFDVVSLDGQCARCPSGFNDRLQLEVAEGVNVTRHLARQLAKSVGAWAAGAAHDSSAVALRACKGRKVERVKEHSVLCLEPRAKFSGCERVQCACAWLWYIV